MFRWIIADVVAPMSEVPKLIIRVINFELVQPTGYANDTSTSRTDRQTAGALRASRGEKVQLSQHVNNHKRFLTEVSLSVSAYSVQESLADAKVNAQFVRIFAGFLWRGGVKRQWGNRKRRFSWLLDATSSAP